MTARTKIICGLDFWAKIIFKKMVQGAMLMLLYYKGSMPVVIPWKNH